MNALALVLVLGAAFGHATWNLLIKQAGGGASFVWIYCTVSAVVYAPLMLLALFYSPHHLGMIGLTFVLGSAFIHVGYFVLLQRGYRVGDLSLLYPLARGSGALIATVAAMLFFGEHPTRLALLGAFGVGVSILFFAWPSGSGRSPQEFFYGPLTGLLIAAYTLWDKHAVSKLGIPPVVMSCGEMVGLAVLLAPTAARNWQEVRSEWKAHRRHALGIGILCPLSYILVLTALTFSPVSYIAPAREISILIGAVMGTRVLAEGHPRRRLVAATMMVLGVIALAVG
jgi:drug/metabolite transporter (DMT)-like permease